MGMEDTKKALEKKGYEVKVFETKQQAVHNLKDSIHGETVGFVEACQSI